MRPGMSGTVGGRGSSHDPGLGSFLTQWLGATTAQELDAAQRWLLTQLRRASTPRIPITIPVGDAHTWGARDRIPINAAGLRILQDHADDSDLLPEEAAILRGYSGWGGIFPGDIDLGRTPLPEPWATGVREWKAIGANRTLPTTNPFSGMLDQFFTPPPVIRAMWELANRALPITATYGLEPSAGIGRFLQLTPDEQPPIEWALVEKDPMLARALGLLYPEATVYQEPFETFATHTLRQPGRFDLCLMNPPYGKWLHPNLDREIRVSDLQDYFTIRTMDLLAPGGVLVTIAPAGQLTGASNVPLRTALLDRCFFAGGLLMGSDIFERLGAAPAAGLAISVWIRIPAGARQRSGFGHQGYYPHEGSFLSGHYFRGEDEGRRSVIGEWKRNRFGDEVVQGAFDEVAASLIPLFPLPPDLLTQVMEARKDVVHPSLSPRITEAASAGNLGLLSPTGLRDATAEGTILLRRLERFRLVQPQNPGLAEAGRSELVADLQEYLEHFGASAEGVIPDIQEQVRILAIGADPAWVNRPPDVQDPVAVIRWISARQGACTLSDLLRYYMGSPDMATEAVRGTDDIAIDFAQRQPAFYRQQDYLSGNLYARQDQAKSDLEQHPEWADRIQKQLGWLEENLSHRTITEINFNPRSGFIPTEVVTEFATESWIPKIERSYQGVKSKEAIWTVLSEEGRWKAKRLGRITDDKTLAKEIHGRMAFLLGYLNRETMVDDGESPQRFGRYKSQDPKEQQAEDEALEEAFTTWVAGNEKWRPIVEDAYNRAFFGDRPRDYPSDPVDILRLSPTRVLHPHQNRGIRWFSDRRVGLLAWDTGVGKTDGGIGILSALRQAGKARRIVVVVPNAVLTNWIRSVRQALPDYRIGTIGLTYDPRRGLYVSDVGKDTDRRAKWSAFAAGAYDVLLCTRSAFKRDVSTRADTQYKLLSQIEWLKRGQAASEEDAALLRRKIEAANADLKELLGKLAYAEKNGYQDDKKKAEAKIADVQRKIARWEDALKLPGRSTLAKIQAKVQALSEQGLFTEAGATPLVYFEDLAVDTLIVDEAHNYKNLYYPAPRYGADAIAYMGAAKDSDDYENMTVQSWDLYLKSSHLSREGGACLLLTATPVKNSPLEVYNLFSYFGLDFWTSRDIRSAEEWIDRYLELAPDTTITSDMQLKNQLGVDDFTEATRPELDAVFQAVMYRITMDQAITLGLIPKALMPDKDEVPADVDMDPIQAEVYEKLRRIKRMEDALSDLAEVQAPTSMVLSQMDQRGKAALAPMILVWDTAEVQERICLDAWTDKDPPPVVTLTYPTYALIEEGGDVEVLEKAEAIMQSVGVPTEVKLFPAQVLERAGHRPGGVWKRPKVPTLTTVQAANLTRRLFSLMSLPLAEIQVYYSRVYPPKIRALCAAIRGNVDCGHVVFLNASTKLFPTIREALVREAHVPPDRILEITGAIDLNARAAVADAFNGADADPLTGAPEVPPTASVVLGTDAMAEGVNLQRRTCAIHHLDLPWEPATLRQRNGRGVRQGNRLGSVAVRYYVARRSTDMKRKDMILGKSTWQEQLLAGSTSGAIQLKTDWDEIKIREFADSEAEADMLIEQMRQTKAIRLRARFAGEATREFASLVETYRQARAITDPGMRTVRLQLADAKAKRLRLTWEREGVATGAIDAAREHAVLAWPLDNFWIVAEERIGVASTSPDDREYHTTPTSLEVGMVRTLVGSMTVRMFGDVRQHWIVAPHGGKLPTALLSPDQHTPPAIRGGLRRVPIRWDVEEDRKLAIQKALLKDIDLWAPAFQTPEFISEVWTRFLGPDPNVQPSWITAMPSSASNTSAMVLLRRSGTGADVVTLSRLTAQTQASQGPGRRVLGQFLLQFRPAIPGYPPDWQRVIDALATDTGIPPVGVADGWSHTGARVILPTRRDSSQISELRNQIQAWMRRYPAQAAFRLRYE